MAVQLVSTRDAARNNGIKLLVYGPAGSGKTRLVLTAKNPVLISAEGGILSLLKELDDGDRDIPMIAVSSIEEMRDAYEWAASDESAQFDWICIDSISEIAERILQVEKADAGDPRQAYGAMQDQMYELIRNFRDLPNRNVYFSAKQERMKDDDGKMLFQPSMPGGKLSQAVPYFFDEVFPLRVEKDEKGEAYRVLQTGRDPRFEAKDRSGRLDMWELPDLAHIAAKISGVGPVDDTPQPEPVDQQEQQEAEQE